MLTKALVQMELESAGLLLNGCFSYFLSSNVWSLYSFDALLRPLGMLAVVEVHTAAASAGGRQKAAQEQCTTAGEAGRHNSFIRCYG